MARQLEQPHDADDREELEDVRILEVGREPLQDQIDEEAERRDVVDDIYRWGDEP